MLQTSTPGPRGGPPKLTILGGDHQLEAVSSPATEPGVLLDGLREFLWHGDGHRHRFHVEDCGILN